MTNNDEKNPKPGDSSSRFALEVKGNDPSPIDPTDKAAVVRWQKAERKRLLRARIHVRHKLPQLAIEIAEEISRLIDLRPGIIVSLYWPMRGELDFCDWMRTLVEQKVRVALPVVIQKAHPMIFREWTPEARMEPGIWNIPVPAEGDAVTPKVVIAPLVGFDDGCYRMGYGGGYFDRTLASLTSKPTVIGVGPPVCEIATIYPQPHDIPMDIIITGAGQVRFRDNAASR